MCLLLSGSTSGPASMSRIHPSDRGDGARRAARTAAAAERERQQPAVYTVWKRSSMGFQGTDGFSVYDAAGRLAFRVDNYARRPKAFAGELLLMDGRGAPLLSLRPQIFSLHDRWNCYRVAPGEEGCPETDKSSSAQQLFSMRKCAALQSTDDAEVHMSTASAATTSGRGCRAPPSPPSGYRVEGCFSRRSCKITRSDGQEAARILRKKAGGPTAAAASSSRPVALGDDVFSLVVRPGVDAATVMAIVVVMDRICRKPYAPMACSAQ
ncbi:protein LURP-one-related 8-like [Triticum urartu]|nr:protein LURP-one-related 8-like [Triticum urartu]XP_048529467.1 protein LURP-one-related 8-like [Triticum urartu]